MSALTMMFQYTLSRRVVLTPLIYIEVSRYWMAIILELDGHLQTLDCHAIKYVPVAGW